MNKKVLAACCAFFAASSVPSSEAAEVTLRFATINQPATRTFKEQMIPLKDAIEKQSEGRIEVDLGGLGKFGRPTELFAMVEKGGIEMASTVQGYMPGRFPRSSVMELPLLYDTAESGTRAMWKMFEEGLLAKDYESVKVLSLYVLPPYAILTSGADVATVRDIRGLRLRSPSLTVGFALSRLGAIPLGLPLDHIGTSLTANLIDGISYGIDSATTTMGDGKLLLEQVKVVVDARFAAPALMIVMNKAAYDGLAPDVRAVIDRTTGLEASLEIARGRDRWEDEARKRVVANGQHTVRRLTPEQRREIESRVAPVMHDWAAAMARQGIDGMKILSRARELVRQKSS